MKKKKLKVLIYEHGIKIQDVAKALNITDSALYYKFNGDTEFKVSEMFKLCDMLNIQDTEIRTYFYDSDN